MSEFESFLIATCADYKHWLKNWVYFNGRSYSPVNYRDHHHCAKASSISIALLSWRFQQSKIEQLEKRITKTLDMLAGDLSYVKEDRRRDFDSLQMAVIRCLKDDIKTLRGECD